MLGAPRRRRRLQDTKVLEALPWPSAALAADHRSRSETCRQEPREGGEKTAERIAFSLSVMTGWRFAAGCCW